MTAHAQRIRICQAKTGKIQATASLTKELSIYLSIYLCIYISIPRLSPTQCIPASLESIHIYLSIYLLRPLLSPAPLFSMPLPPPCLGDVIYLSSISIHAPASHSGRCNLPAFWSAQCIPQLCGVKVVVTAVLVFLHLLRFFIM